MLHALVLPQLVHRRRSLIRARVAADAEPVPRVTVAQHAHDGGVVAAAPQLALERLGVLIGNGAGGVTRASTCGAAGGGGAITAVGAAGFGLATCTGGGTLFTGTGRGSTATGAGACAGGATGFATAGGRLSFATAVPAGAAAASSCAGLVAALAGGVGSVGRRSPPWRATSLS